MFKAVVLSFALEPSKCNKTFDYFLSKVLDKTQMWG